MSGERFVRNRVFFRLTRVGNELEAGFNRGSSVSAAFCHDFHLERSISHLADRKLVCPQDAN
jgi:hypothetical protein